MNSGQNVRDNWKGQNKKTLDATKKRELSAAVEDQWPWHICPWAYMESMWPVFTCRTGFQVNKVTAVLCSGPWREETQGSSDATIVELASWYKHNVYGIGPIPVLDHWLFSLLVVASCQGNNEIIYCVIFEWAQNLTFQPSETSRVDNNISSKGSKVQHSDGISPFFLLTESQAPENAHGLPRLCATCSQHRSLREILEQDGTTTPAKVEALLHSAFAIEFGFFLFTLLKVQCVKSLRKCGI